MACNLVKNGAAVTNQLDAATAAGIARSHVKLGKNFGAAPTFTTKKNMKNKKNYNMAAIKMQVVIDDQKKTTKPAMINNGKFGKFGGKFVPESLITCLSKLEAEFNLVLHDSKFQVSKFKSISFIYFYLRNMEEYGERNN